MIWAHQWGKTACDSLSYRSEHNEEDTAINPPKGGGKKTYQRRRGKRRGWERHIINTNTPLNYFKRDFGQFLELVLRKKAEGEANMFEGRKANKCKRYNLPLNGGVQWRCVLQKRGVLSLSESQHTITLVTPQPRCLYLFQETAYSFPRRSRNIKTASRVIVAQSPKYCSVLSPRQINRAQTASVCFLITSSYPHKHSVTLWTVSEKGQNLPSTSNWNVPTEILSGYQLGYMCQAWHTDQMLHQREIQWLYPWAGKAVKNPEMQLRASALYCASELNQNKWRINN